MFCTEVEEKSMSQINIHLTTELEQALAEYMRLRRIKTKSDAVRLAVLEGLERERRSREAPDFSRWLGLATGAPENPRPRFRSDDDLWS
jgi:Arc/MetJ family transcription regulator